MGRVLIKGNEAIVKGALLAGCRSFYGYPITPASEIAHAASEYFLPLGKVFVQAECEVGAINMVFGSASSGLRTMTASSGPGISLKMEGISYLAGAELPVVIVNIMRAGPGRGNIAPAQADIKLACRRLGHGNTHAIVLAPTTPQGMLDVTMEAIRVAGFSILMTRLRSIGVPMTTASTSAALMVFSRSCICFSP